MWFSALIPIRKEVNLPLARSGLGSVEAELTLAHSELGLIVFKLNSNWKGRKSDTGTLWLRIVRFEIDFELNKEAKLTLALSGLGFVVFYLNSN